MIYIMHPQQDEILGYITPDNYWEDEHHHGLDGVNFIQFGTYADSEEAQHLTDRCRLIAQGSSGVWQEFIAHQISTRTGRKLKIVATGSEMELDGLKIIYPQTFTGATLEYCLSIATSDTDWQSGIVDHASFQTQTFEQHLGGYAFLLRIANYYDRELRFRIEVSGNRFVGRYIDMVERVGADKRKEIVAGSNLISIDRTFHSKDVITGLICRGPEREDGSLLEIRVTDDEAFQRWNRNNNHIWDFYEPESTDAEMTEERLRSLGTTELKKRINAVVEYEIEAAVLEDDDVQLGDTLRIKDENFEPPLYAESRAIFVKERIGREDLQKTYTIGEITELEEDEVLRNARKAQARYGTKILRSPLPPPIQKAIWFQTNPEEPDKLEIPHVPDMSSQTWKPASAKTAGEIGGIELNKQYNGVSWSEEEGIVVDRTDELVRSVVNATEGISVQARKFTAEDFQKVFFVDGEGNLNMVGIMYGSSIILGGEESGSLTILGEDGAPIAQLDENVRDMPDLTVGHLDAPNKVEYIDFGDTPFVQHVAAEAMNGVAEPSDGNTGLDWGSPLQTVSEALRRLPRMFDGVAEISLAYGQTYNEEVFISGFTGRGTLIIRNSADTTRAAVSGKAEITNNSIFVEWRDLNLNSTDPYAGFFARGSVGKLVNCRINGAAGDTSFGVNVNSGAFFELYNCSYFNCVTAVRASYGGNAYMSDNTGEVSGTAIQAFGGGMVSGQGTAPTGGAGNTSEIAGGQVTGTWNFPTPPSAPAPVTKTTKETFNSSTSASGTWRADENKWDATSYYGSYATQGSYYGYGPFTGAWFFGALPTGKKIKSMRLYVSRKAGGVNAKVNVSFRPHTNASRPSGNVSMQSTWHSVGIAVGESKWISLPSKFFAGFESGSYKGMAIGGSAYAKLGVSVKLEITYEEVA
ncbi:phage tail protein [Planococcus sp. A6]|uniref:phage tail spike protein n=1 Tax=Planococcus sp. A6 TaxID=2992760 RepID=UPI00237A7204|nr:phage tail spike protein [Planococcus sp. A6]MDE0581562.1 phage tail protein [Planococcus sp. A6]